jgi:gas vesicle protein
MTRKEKAKKNIRLTFDFIRQVINDPKIVDKLPSGSILEFVENDASPIKKALKKSKSKIGSKRKFLRVKSHFEVIA